MVGPRIMTLAQKLDFYSMPEPNSGCALWLGSHNEKGYGQLWWDNKNHKAHRLSWRARNGAVPSGMSVLHRCDNPACINPDHLFIGSQKDNLADMARKGRHGLARLVREDIPVIRRLVAEGRTLVEVAKRYNVTPETIGYIKNHKIWLHVP